MWGFMGAGKRAGRAVRRGSLVLCAVAVIAGGCAKGGSDIKLVVASSPDKTEAADTANYQMDFKVVSDTTDTMTMTGAMDFEHSLVSMKMAVEDEAIDAVLDDSAMYMKFPDAEDELPKGKSWVKLSFKDLAKLGGPEGLDALGAGGQNDPTSQISQLRGAGDVTNLGSETVRGASTTHYRTQVDLNKAIEKADKSDAKEMRDVIKQLGMSTLPIDVWLDSEDRIARFREDIDLSHAKLTGDEASLKSISVTMELFDFGKPVNVAVPDASEVVKFTDQFGNIPANGKGSGTDTAATKALEPKILTTSLAGYTRELDDVGDTGPSDLAKAVRDDGEDDAKDALVKAGFVAGYQRLWTKGDNEVIDFVYQFKAPSGAASYMQRSIGDENDSDPSLTITPFVVSGIPGAKGFTVTDGTDKSAVVFFTRGAYMGQIMLNGTDSTPANASLVAKAQFDKLG